MPKVMTPGHEEEVIRLLRLLLLLVAKHYSWIWSPEMVLISALWQSVPDLGLGSCRVDPMDMIASLYESPWESVLSELCHFYLLWFISPVCIVRAQEIASEWMRMGCTINMHETSTKLGGWQDSIETHEWSKNRLTFFFWRQETVYLRRWESFLFRVLRTNDITNN